jgi:hypothetical protein
MRRGQYATSTGRFGKSLKWLSRRVKGENWILSLRKHVILHLSFQKKWVILKMETCNDNYGRTKNDNINEWNEEKKVKYKERNNWKKNLYWLLIWLLWNVSLNKDNLWDIHVIIGGTIGMVQQQQQGSMKRVSTTGRWSAPILSN